MLILLTLGIVQGIAEFLPISSSGHLVLLEQFKYFKTELEKIGNINLFVNVSLHMASLLAVLIYLWNDIIALIKGVFQGIAAGDFQKSEIKTVTYIIAASIPAGIIGLIFHDYLEKIFSSVTIVSIFLIINGFILITTKKIPQKDRNIEELGLIRSIIIGFYQAFAILPGISRSGMTITGGLFMGLKPIESAKFSFLIAVPVIAGAGLLEAVKAFRGSFPMELLFPLLAAMLVTLVVALISLRILFALVKRVKIDIFGYYTIVIGITVIILVNVI
ncbi:undecaprenyl-diphosphate phosphatase [Spirochaetota bacterium]